MSNQKDLSIIIPFYNEEKSINEVANKLISTFSESKLVFITWCSALFFNVIFLSGKSVGFISFNGCMARPGTLSNNVKDSYGKVIEY